MLAVMLAEFGPPSVLTPAELPDPVPGPGQVVVEAAFANITFVETQIRAGRRRTRRWRPRSRRCSATGWAAS